MSYTISDSSEQEQPVWQAPEGKCPECRAAVVTDGGLRWCVNTDCDWVRAPVDSAAGSAQHGIQKSERYEAHSLSETVAVTRADEKRGADEEREIYLLEIAHKGLDYELTREQAHALKECLRLALS
jgi:hypothetical protein